MPSIALPNPEEGVEPSQAAILTGVLFWILLTLVASALPVQMPRGTKQAVSIAPIVGSLILGGPAAGVWVAALGTTEIRELRGRIPWYGTLVNHAAVTLPAFAAGLVLHIVVRPKPWIGIDFLGGMVAGVTFYFTNQLLSAGFVALRSGESVATVFIGDSRDSTATSLALVALAWLMSVAYQAIWWSASLFVLPLYTARLSYQKLMEMRLMFTQTIGALAEAVDKRDPFTAKHSQNVKSIGVEIGRAMRLGDSQLEALEWGGLLHDVGKIGVPDAVLLKAERLSKDERMVMNSHPVLGAQIIAPVQRLAPELPIIRHHHEWYNGSGYPDRLIGDEIPLLARILHVADAFEAMTAARPYRMTPLTRRAGAERATQVRRHPVRPGGRRRVRQDALRRGRARRGAPCPAPPDPAHRPSRGDHGRRPAARRPRTGRAGLIRSDGGILSSTSAQRRSPPPTVTAR